MEKYNTATVAVWHKPMTPTSVMPTFGGTGAPRCAPAVIPAGGIAGTVVRDRRFATATLEGNDPGTPVWRPPT